MSNRNLEAGLRRLMAQQADGLGVKSTENWSEAGATSNRNKPWIYKEEKKAVFSEPSEYLPDSVLETLEEIVGAANDGLDSSKRAIW